MKDLLTAFIMFPMFPFLAVVDFFRHRRAVAEDQAWWAAVPLALMAEAREQFVPLDRMSLWASIKLWLYMSLNAIAHAKHHYRLGTRSGEVALVSRMAHQRAIVGKYEIEEKGK